MTFTALILIILLYIIPLNNIVYIWSESIANYIISMPQIKIPDIKIIQIIAFKTDKWYNLRMYVRKHNDFFYYGLQDSSR